MIIIGIDPGQSGGLVAIDNEGFIMLVESFTKLTQPDIGYIFSDILKTKHERIKCYIEKVGAMPKQGVSSTFKFGYNTGFLHGLLIAHKIPFEEVTPQRWQKLFSIPKLEKTERKNLIKQKAQELFPSQKFTLSTSDACLIAEYGRRKEGFETYVNAF